MKIKSMMLVSILGFVVTCGNLIAFPWGAVVGPTSIKVSPERTSYAEDWVAETNYTQGVLVMSTNNMVYMVVTNGTSGTTPPVFGTTYGVDDVDFAYRRVVPNPRKYVVAVNSSTSTIWVAYGEEAVVDRGIPIYPNGGSWEIPTDISVDGAIYAIGESSATNLVISGEER